MAEPLTTGLIMGGSALGGSLLEGLFAYKGFKEQAREGRKTRAVQLKTFQQEFAEDKRQFGEMQKLEEKKLAQNEETNNFNKRQAYVNNFLTSLNSNPSAASNFINLSRGRR